MDQLINQPSTLPFQKQDGIVNIAFVLFLTDQTDARCGAALDLMLQTGARTGVVLRIFTLPNRKNLLQQL
jgi:hypothetical protein